MGKMRQKSGSYGDGGYAEGVAGVGKTSSTAKGYSSSHAPGPGAKGGSRIVQNQHGRHSMSTVPQLSGKMKSNARTGSTMASGSRGDDGGRGYGPAAGKGTGFGKSSPNPRNPYKKG